MKKIHSLLSVICLFLLVSCASVGGNGGSAKTEYLRTDFPASAALAKGSYFPALAGIAPDPETSLAAADADWFKDQNFYHIWVSAFSDSDSDGIGDIRGITAKLDYLKELGVTAIWLSPFCKSASSRSNLHCYDTIDYYQVDPRFGTNEDVKNLLDTAHEKGLRIIFDMVPNHVSDENPWFVASKRGDPDKRAWFLWTEKVPETGWKDWGGRSAWRAAGRKADGNIQYNYAIFWSKMPDLNYRNPEVRKAVADATIFWLNMGFDGIRMDAVRYLFEDLQTGLNGVDKTCPESSEFFRQYRSEVLDRYGALGYSKFMVAENWTGDRASLKEFIEKDGKKGFQMTMDFSFGSLASQSISGGPDYYSSAIGLESYWKGFGNQFLSDGGWLATFLNNHDNYQSRPYTGFGGNQGKIDLAVVLQYTGLGTPFWYYGNELDMEGQNNGQDTNFRKPMTWDRVAGFKANPASTYSQAKSLMNLRSSRVSLRRGSFVPAVSGNDGIKAFMRTDGSEKTLVIMNFTSGPLPVSVDTGNAGTRTRLLLGSSPAVAGRDYGMKDGRVSAETLEAWGFAVLALE